MVVVYESDRLGHVIAILEMNSFEVLTFDAAQNTFDDLQLKKLILHN